MAKRSKSASRVGYRNPPTHSRFPPGTSGNPSGRPKGVKSVERMLREILYRKVPLTEGDKTRRVTLLEAFLMRVTKDAVQGDPRAADRLLKLLPILVAAIERENAEAQANAETPLRDSDRAVLEALVEAMGPGGLAALLEDSNDPPVE